ncbi:MAG: type VI secretion system tube protein Hcp [Deltaproteobacteria bacterium]|nr:type VI secretion system tube protein Hcp [Deltaproteobacteria bacterium]
MAMTSYLKLEGKNQGAIEGDCTQKGHEKWILVYGLDWGMEIPRDVHTGLPTGQRIHHPISIKKKLDPASPLIAQACASGEQMKTWQLDFHHISEKGQEELYYTIVLENAIVVAITYEKPLTFLEENKPYHDMETVAFTYEKITWSHKKANKEAVDDWKAPKA